MNTKKLLMAGMVSLSMICSGGLLVGCSNTSKTTNTEITNKRTETKTIGEKTENSKTLKVINKTGKGITVFETKSSSDEAFSENLLTDGDVVKKNENRVLYYTTNENDTLSIKVGLKNSDSTFTFDKVDETEKIKNVEINLNDDGKIELTVNKKDDSKITIKATADEKKSDDEKENEEKVDETAKAEDDKSESDKTASSSTSSKSENKTSTTNNSASNSSNSNKGNSSNTNSSNKDNSSSSQHTHDWVAVYETVDVPEQGHNEQALVNEAYDEQIPQYAYVERQICGNCGQDITNLGNDGIATHMEAHALAGDGNKGYHSEVRETLTGYTIVHHDAEYATKYVVDQVATTKKVLKGYKCSTCGKTK